MKITVLIIITLIATFTLGAQVNSNKFDFKIGTVVGFMGSGDMQTLGLENELNYKLDKYFTTAISIGIGKSDYGVDLHTDYLMGSANIFISPFKNNGKNNFRIGTGYSFFNHTNIWWSYWDSTNGYTYDFSKKKTGGFNLIIEDEQIIYSKYLIGGKLFLNGNISEANFVGGAIKLGILL